MQNNIGLPKDITKYVDLKSPILKYLIEIEKKHWDSTINKNYRLPSRVKSSNLNEDSESSIVSLKNVTTYLLASQNDNLFRKDVTYKDKSKVGMGNENSRNYGSGFKSQPRPANVGNENGRGLVDFNQINKNRAHKGNILIHETPNQNIMNKTKYEHRLGPSHLKQNLDSIKKQGLEKVDKEQRSRDNYLIDKDANKNYMAKEFQYDGFEATRLKFENMTRKEQQERSKRLLIDERSRSPIDSKRTKPLVINKSHQTLKISSSSLLKNTGYINSRSPQGEKSHRVSGMVMKDSSNYLLESAYSKLGLGAFASNRQEGVKANRRSQIDPHKTVNLAYGSGISSSNYLITGSHMKLHERSEKKKINISDVNFGQSPSKISRDTLHLNLIKDKNILNMKKGPILIGSSNRLQNNSSLIHNSNSSNIRPSNKLLYSTIRAKLENSRPL